MIAAIETALSIEAVFPALGLISLLRVAVIVFLIHKTSQDDSTISS
jgi:hypothetical protein